MDRSLVKGNKLVPAPPPITIASVFFWREFEFIFDRGSKSLFSAGLFSRAPKTLCHYSASASSSQRRRRRYGLLPQAAKEQCLVVGRFIETPDGRVIYFHRSRVLNSAFEHFEIGDEVFDVPKPGQQEKSFSVAN